MRSEGARLIEARVERRDRSIVPCLAFSPLRHLLRFIFLLRGAGPSQVNNKSDEAQQPPGTRNNPFCDKHCRSLREQFSAVENNGLRFGGLRLDM